MAKKQTTKRRPIKKLRQQPGGAWKEKFLDFLSEYGNVTAAAKSAGINRCHA